MRSRIGLAVAAVAVALVASSAASAGRTLAPGAAFFVPPPDQAAVRQVLTLGAHGDVKDAALLVSEQAVPRAVWLIGGSNAEAQKQVRTTLAEAALERRVPVFVIYDIPGRDCGSYSAGGAQTTADYAAYVDAVSAALGPATAVVILEPDALANLPSDCPNSRPDLDADRYAQIRYAASTLESAANANLSVYLDAGHSAWHSVGDMASRLVQAGVAQTQGFFLNVSNYQYTRNQVFFGTWVSDCISMIESGRTTVATAGDGCPNQYWNGGPTTNWQGTALTPFGVWSDGASTLDLNTAGIDSRYAGVTPTTHFVIDTSRNGTGPNDMSTYGAAPYNQSSSTVAVLRNGDWCNPPAAGLGARPTASTGNVLVDAYLWIKTPGESDGQCDSAGGVRAWDYAAYNPWGVDVPTQALFDPLWGQVDPTAGAWFPAQALQLAQNASPALLP